MNTTTIDHTLTFAQAIATYLNINTQYRKAIRNPEKRQQLTRPRTESFLHAERQNVTLHAHLNTLTEPDFIGLQAKKLIELWDRRNHCFNQLSERPANKTWHETPNDAIIRLNIAEKKLLEHLKTIHTIIGKLA